METKKQNILAVTMFALLLLAPFIVEVIAGAFI